MHQVKKISDKVRIVSDSTDKFKTGHISISLALPMDERMAANALLLYLMKRSCKAYPDFSCLNGRLDELYGASISAFITKTGESQVLNLAVTCLADKFALENESIVEQCADLLANMIFMPDCDNGHFNEEALADEKRLLIQRIGEELDDKRVYAANRCISNMCCDEAYGKDKYGTVEEIEAVTTSDVYDAWENMLKVAVIQINVVGSADEEKIATVFENGFANIQRAPACIETVFVKRGRRFNRYEEEFPVNQGKLVFGFRLGTESSRDKMFEEIVMNDIFGGGPYSKLFANVREKLSLAYYCRSRTILSKGLMLVECGIDTNNERKASAEILSQLSDIRNGKTDPDTLKASKMSLKERFTFTTPDEIASWYASQILEDDIMTAEEMAAGIDSVTMEQVCSAAKRLSIDTIFMLKAQEATDEN